MNFHKDLLAMSQEVHYWERMRMSIPYIAMEINAQREKYRILQENVLVVVRDYNQVITRYCAAETQDIAGESKESSSCIFNGIVQ